MKELSPGATSLRNRHDGVWYRQQMFAFAKASFGMLNDGKMQSLPYIVFASVYAVAIVTRAFWPNHIIFFTAIFALVGFLCIASLIFFVSNHARPEVLYNSASIAVGFLWLSAAFNQGLEIRVLIIGAIITTIVGIPYWLELGRMNHPSQTFLSPQITEPAEPVNEWAEVKWMQPNGRWNNAPRRTETGYIRELKLPSGVNARKFIDTHGPGLANHLQIDIEDIELEEVKKRADLVTVMVHSDRDYFDETIIWPLAKSDKFSLWEPIPLGIRKSGDIVYLDLNEKHLLIGGESGSGKSNVTSMICAMGAADPYCDMWLFDGKRNELFHWRNSARGYVQDDINHANMMIDHILQEMFWRYDKMNDLGHMCRKAQESNGLFGPVLVVIDELAGYLREDGRDAPARKHFLSALATLLEKGRAAGFIVVANTQRPSAKLFDGGDLRAGFTYRLALRMADGRGSAMILGDGYGAYDSSKFDQECRGMAYMIEKGSPKLLRAFYVPNETLESMVASAPKLEDVEVWGQYLSIDKSKPKELVSKLYDFEIAEGKAALPSSAELTSTGGKRERKPNGVYLPDGEELTEPWHIQLWESISETEFHASSYFEKICKKTRNPVIIILRRWTENGWLEPTLDGATTKWRKKAQED